MIKYGRVTEVRRSILLGVSHVLVPRGLAPAASPNFWDPTYLHPNGLT